MRVTNPHTVSYSMVVIYSVVPPFYRYGMDNGLISVILEIIVKLAKKVFFKVFSLW